MKKMRTLVVMHESLVPPENLEGHTDKEIEEWRTEYDVSTTLRKAGHDVRCMGVLDSLTELRNSVRLSSTPMQRTSWPALRRVVVTSYSVRHSSISLSV